LRLANTFSFFQIDHTDDSEEGGGGSLLGKIVNFYLESEFPFYTAYLKKLSEAIRSAVQLKRRSSGSTSNEHDITTYHCLLTLLKFTLFLVLKIMKVGFESAVVSAINEKTFPDSVITGCNFYLNQCLWQHRQTLG
jgi:hypothetical protein